MIIIDDDDDDDDDDALLIISRWLWCIIFTYDYNDWLVVIVIVIVIYDVSKYQYRWVFCSRDGTSTVLLEQLYWYCSTYHYLTKFKEWATVCYCYHPYFW